MLKTNHPADMVPQFEFRIGNEPLCSEDAFSPAIYEPMFLVSSYGQA